MKILHISTTDTGGAGLAALRLHTSLLEQGYNSSFLCLHKTTNVEKVFQYPVRYIGIHYRLLNKLGIPLTNEFKNKKKTRKILPILISEAYSLPKTDYNVHTHNLVKECDIIILHWVAGFVDITTFFKHIILPKKLYWYIHDFNVIQGGFHTLFDASLNTNPEIVKFENQLKKIKRKSLDISANLNLIANSNFTYKNLIESKVIKRSMIKLIPLGVPESELSKIDKIAAKMALTINPNSFVILTSAVNLKTKRKGYDRLIEIIKSLSTAKPKKQITIISIGQNLFTEQFPKNIKLLNLGFFWNPIFKSIAYSSADIVISTSYEETFGQTLVEGYACGTPCIAFNNAALPELIENGLSGYICNTPEECSQKIIELTENNKLLAKLSSYAYNLYLEKYTSKLQVNRLIKTIT
jgi:glycosyltransferase involved in cell wall biosynthesis